MDDFADPPVSASTVLPVVRPHLPRLGEVLRAAWRDYQLLRDQPDSAMTRAGAATRSMLVTDFVRTPAHQAFAGVKGVSVVDRYGRPWVSLHGGRVQVRFKRLTGGLRVCPSDTERQTRLAYHLGDPCLPGAPEATILTAGYVLDDSGATLTGTHLVCHFGDEALYSFALPDSAALPRQLPLVPLSPPVIRSARTVVRERLDGATGVR